MVLKMLTSVLLLVALSSITSLQITMAMQNGRSMPRSDIGVGVGCSVLDPRAEHPTPNTDHPIPRLTPIAGHGIIQAIQFQRPTRGTRARAPAAWPGARLSLCGG